MKRTLAALSVLSLVFSFTVAAFGQTLSTQQSKPEHLSKQQLNALITTANTTADHERIARYYRAEVLEYLAQAKEHEAMVSAYKANSTLSNNKNQASTISHCEYFVTTFKALADNSRELAEFHEQMAKEASLKLAPTGK
jgi:Na+-transporting NADH:ubiquinone oxidoreductase subunit NqrC